MQFPGVPSGGGEGHAQAGCDPGGRHGRLLAAHGRRRGGHHRAPEGAPWRGDRPGHRRARRPGGQDHRRWPAGRVPERRGCGRLRGRGAGRPGAARSRSARSAAHALSHGYQPGRHRHRGRRHPGRRRQYRGPPGSARRGRRHLHLRRRLPPGSQQARPRVRGSGRAAGQEHRRAGPHLPDRAPICPRSPACS
jgi:hypothetical protein